MIPPKAFALEHRNHSKPFQVRNKCFMRYKTYYIFCKIRKMAYAILQISCTAGRVVVVVVVVVAVVVAAAAAGVVVVVVVVVVAVAVASGSGSGSGSAPTFRSSNNNPSPARPVPPCPCPAPPPLPLPLPLPLLPRPHSPCLRTTIPRPPASPPPPPLNVTWACIPLQGVQEHRHTGVLFYCRRTAVDSYSARTSSNRHGYMQVIRETDRHLDV